MDIAKVLTELSQMAGPSGFERAVADRAAELLAPFCDEVVIDKLCNVRGTRKAAVPNAPKLLLSAHLDEIGLMVTKIEEGYLRFCTVGGIDSRILPAREVKVMTEPPIFGVVTSIPPHLLKPDEHKTPFELSALAIDVGMSQERAEQLIPIGTTVVYNEKAIMLGDKLFSGKSMDDRACFVLLLRVLELLQGKDLPVELVIQASSQEEVGAVGARVGAFAEAPDWAIAVDVTFAETPDSPSDKTMKFGGGVPILIGPNGNRKLTGRLVELAKEKELGVQMEVTEGNSGTDAWLMQTVAYGTATGVVSLPLRYMHTAVEVINLDDLEAAAKLLAAFALAPEAEALRIKN